MANSSDESLVKRLKERDEDAFREFIQTHQNQVFNLVYRMLNSREEAEDVSQEVFVTVFKAIDTFREESKLSTWLFRITANHAKNRLKYLSRRRRDGQRSLSDMSDSDLHRIPGILGGEPEGVAFSHEMEGLVQEGLSLLDEDHRLVLVLRDMENMSYEEIADVAEVAVGTVKSRLHRARASLRQHLVRLERKRVVR